MNPIPASAPVRASTEPDLTFLMTEYRRAKTDGAMQTRLSEAEDVRFTRWDSQTSDGLKHQKRLGAGERVSPWEACFDTRQPIADDVINGIVDLLTVAFWNSRVRSDPVNGRRLSAIQAAEMRQMTSWLLRGALCKTLAHEIELCAQGAATVGHAVIYTGWRQETTLRQETITTQGLAALMPQMPNPGIVQSLLGLIADPLAEEAAAQMLSEVFPDLKAARAQRVVRDLRTTGTAEFPVPSQTRNLPEITVLRPGDDFFVPPETTDLTLAPIVFRRVWMSPQRVEAEGITAEWDKDFIERAKEAGSGYAADDQRSGYDQKSSPQSKNLVEIVYAYAWANDADGVPGIYCTVYCPNVAGLYGKHHLLDYAAPEDTFTAFQMEVPSRRLLDSRGVPETYLGTGQGVFKCGVDALLDRALIELKPPIVRNGMSPTDTIIGPDARLTELVPGETRYLETPKGNPRLMLALMEFLKDFRDDYFGRLSEKTPTTVAQVRQQRLVSRWLGAWSTAFHQALVLCYQYMKPEEIGEILGRPPQLNVEILTKNRMILWFDVRSLDSEWVQKMLETIATYVLPNDTGGAVDRNKLISFWLSYLDPTLAEEVMTDREGAAQALYKSVRDEMVAIQAGNEPLLQDASNDPTGPMKAQFAQQVMQTNPKLHQSAQQDPLVAQRLQKYLENIQQAAVQQQNKQTGRLGVQPQQPA